MTSRLEEEMSGYQPPEVTSSTHSYASSYDDFYEQVF